MRVRHGRSANAFAGSAATAFLDCPVAPAQIAADGRGRELRRLAFAPSDDAMRAHDAVLALGQGRSRSWADARDASGPSVRGRTDHQSAPGAEPALWRHDLGRVVRAARAGDHGPALCPSDECQSGRVPPSRERRRAGARGVHLVTEDDPHVNALGIKGAARSASPARRARSRTPPGTPRAGACANFRSRWIG